MVNENAQAVEREKEPSFIEKLTLGLGVAGLITAGVTAYNLLPVNEDVKKEIINYAVWGGIVPFYVYASIKSLFEKD